ncbi:hypothetical protein BGZ47_009857 [Haplosporangium gracile]|nr:hypothetical protein BGZ47_009857 [Haplosporangium gracile]
MDPHAHVQAEFNQYSEQQTREQQQQIVVNGDYEVIADLRGINLFSSSSSESTSVIPVTTITDAPISVAPMDATVVPIGDISEAMVASPGQTANASGNDCCGDDGDCGDCGDCDACEACCTIM